MTDHSPIASRDSPAPDPQPEGPPAIRSRLLGEYSLPAAIAADLARLDDIPFNADYSDYAEGRWASLAVFNQSGDANSSASHEYEGLGQWTAHADKLPAIRAVALDLFDFDRARSARVFVAQKGMIRQHRDYLEFDKGFRRLHLVLRTCPGAFNGEGAVAFHMTEGQVWFVDGTAPHFAINMDDVPRYHLAVDFPADAAFDECVHLDRLAPSAIAWQVRQKIDEEVVDLAKLAAAHASAIDVGALMGKLDRLYARYDFDGLSAYDVALMGCGENPVAAREVTKRRHVFLGM